MPSDLLHLDPRVELRRSAPDRIDEAAAAVHRVLIEEDVHGEPAAARGRIPGLFLPRGDPAGGFGVPVIAHRADPLTIDDDVGGPVALVSEGAVRANYSGADALEHLGGAFHRGGGGGDPHRVPSLDAAGGGVAGGDPQVVLGLDLP